MTDRSEPLEGKAATQDRILRAAGVLFMEQGYGSTTIAEVAERAGVSRATVFWHFGDKAGLFRETLADLLVPFRESIGRDLSDLSPRKQLEQRVASYQDFVQERRDIVQGLLRWVIESPALHATLVDTLMGLNQRYLGLLGECLGSILPPDQNPNDAAAGIMAALHGNMLLGLFDASESAAETRRASTMAILSWIQSK
jgi:AcrR family transcriptional regulator